MTSASESKHAKRRRRFTDRIERDARKMVSSPNARRRGLLGSSLLEDQIALTLDQIDQVRARDIETLQGLLDIECYIGTELMQMEARTPLYAHRRFPEREKLQRRLGQLAKERRRFKTNQDEKLSGLHSKLLDLVGKRRLLAPSRNRELKGASDHH